MKLSIVMPVLNEASRIEAALIALQPFRARGHELIVVDGGSTDATRQCAAEHVDQLVAAARGRAAQLDAGVRHASGDAVLFLHADTTLPAGADAAIERALAQRAWGRFDVSIEGDSAWFPVIATFMNWRSRLSGIATGDQGMFMWREALERIGGVPQLALMEDVAMSKALKRVSPPSCLREQVRTSGRRWIRHGVLKTIGLMWALRLAYFAGVPPARLARIYYGEAA